MYTRFALAGAPALLMMSPALAAPHRTIASDVDAILKRPAMRASQLGVAF